MSISDFNEVVPSEGTLTARIFQHEHSGAVPYLFFDIDVPLQTFTFDDEQVQTSLRLDFIEIPFQENWREISDQTYDFPVNPEAGYIDGSVYLGHAHNPADVTSLSFGKIESGRIVCKLKIHFDFTFERLDELGKPVLEWTVPLKIDEQSLDKVVHEFYTLID
jgi:hypothetical protein